MSIFKKFGRRTTILAVLGALIVSASAVAYFAASGSGTSGAVNTAKTANPGAISLLVTPGPVNGNPLIEPDGALHQYSFTVKNPSAKYTVHVSYSASLGGVTGMESWFSLSLDKNSATIAPGATDTVVASLSMPVNNSVDQSAAENLQPTITLNAS